MTVQVRIQDFDDPHFNPLLSDSAAFGDIADIHSRLRTFRREQPVTEGEFRVLFGGKPDPLTEHFRHFALFRHADVSTVLMNPAIYGSEEAHRWGTQEAFGHMLITMDAPDHTRYRRILQKALSPKIIQTWSDTVVQPTIDRLIDGFVRDGSADLVTQFAVSYPFKIVYALLGLPDDDVETFHRLALVQTMFQTFLPQAREAKAKLGTYLETLLDIRASKPGDDIVSLLATAESDGERMPREVAISILRHLLNAAADTTYRSTGTLLTGLLTHPEQLDAVRSDRELVMPAIDEALRWDGPITSVQRVNAVDVELSGTIIPAGSMLRAVLTSANHDEVVFEEPDSFDIRRKRGPRTMPFGSGPHACIGMPLARLEMRNALNSLFDRLPGLRLDPAYDVPAIRGFMFRSPAHVHVLFDR